MSGQKPREIAFTALNHRSGGGDFIENLLEAALARNPLAGPDRRFCQELAYGVVRWEAVLDWLIQRKTEAGREQPVPVRNALRLGLYQIFWLERVPSHAAVNETVELIKSRVQGGGPGFVNALLRGYLRELDPTRQLLEDLKQRQPALGYSHPEWLLKRWEHQWGAEKSLRLLEWNNSPPPTFARVNLLKTDAGKLLTQWREENVEYNFFRRDWIDENLIFELKQHPSLLRLDSFTQGLFYIQDPSTLLAVTELDPQPGEEVLDLCAAPGGKLTFIAQMMDNRGRLVGHDTSPERFRLIRENCARLGVTCFEPAKPSTLNPQTSAKFDRILVDAPCSNTGVIRRRVDVRWRIKPEEILRLKTLQLDSLNQAAPLLRKGGTLIYSTCSLEPEENSALVRDFLQTRSDLVLDYERWLLPFADGVDGAYVARLTSP